MKNLPHWSLVETCEQAGRDVLLYPVINHLLAKEIGTMIEAQHLHLFVLVYSFRKIPQLEIGKVNKDISEIHF